MKKLRYEFVELNKLYLEANLDSLFVVDSAINGKPLYLDDYPSNKYNVFKFITKKGTANSPSDFFNINKYEKLFYQELTRLLTVISQTNPKKIYLTELGNFDNPKYNLFYTVIRDKLLNTFKDKDNIILLWPSEKENLKEFWAYLDTFGNINIFYQSDKCVPFKHNYMVKDVTLKAIDKEHARELAKQELLNVENKNIE